MSDTEPRAPGCVCTWEQGDSDCPVHACCPDCGYSLETTRLFKARASDLAEIQRLDGELAKARAERDEVALALKLRDDEVAWFEIELERAQHGRRVKERGTEAARAYLAANKSVTSINVNAYTLALDQIEALIPERDTARAEVSRLKAGLCLDVIPSTLIACGEGGNFCSEACRLKAGLREMREWCTGEHASEPVSPRWLRNSIHALIGKESP